MKNRKEKKVFFRTRESESARRMAFFASHTEEEIRAALGVGGALSEEEVREMRAQYGENVLPEPKKRGVPARARGDLLSDGGTLRRGGGEKPRDRLRHRGDGRRVGDLAFRAGDAKRQCGGETALPAHDDGVRAARGRGAAGYHRR